MADSLAIGPSIAVSLTIWVPRINGQRALHGVLEAPKPVHTVLTFGGLGRTSAQGRPENCENCRPDRDQPPCECGHDVRVRLIRNQRSPQVSQHPFAFPSERMPVIPGASSMRTLEAHLTVVNAIQELLPNACGAHGDNLRKTY